MKVNLAAQLAATETDLACPKLSLAQVKDDRDELRRERDRWRREAAKLYAEKLIDAKLASSERLTSGTSLHRSVAHDGGAGG